MPHKRTVIWRIDTRAERTHSGAQYGCQGHPMSAQPRDKHHFCTYGVVYFVSNGTV